MHPRRTQGIDRDFIEQVAANSTFKRLYEPLPLKAKGHTFEAFAFAILTANERTDRAEKALTLVKLGISSEAQIQQLLKSAGLMFYNAKAKAIWSLAQQSMWGGLDVVGNESASQYRDRMLTLHIRGLAFTKTSFAAYLNYGGGDVICADRHILNIYTGKYEAWMTKNTHKAVRLQREVEQYFVRIAAQYNWSSASALQWAVWSESTGIYTDHSVVYN